MGPMNAQNAILLTCNWTVVRPRPNVTAGHYVSHYFASQHHRCAAEITGIARNCVWFPSDLCTQQRRYLTARISVLFMCNNAVVTSVTKCAVIATSSSSAAAAAAAAVLVLVVVELLGDWRSCSCGSWKSCH